MVQGEAPKGKQEQDWMPAGTVLPVKIARPEGKRCIER